MTESPRRRHLMDPANPQPRRPTTAAQDASLTRVQQWVASVLVVSLILHLAAGLVIGAYVMDADERAAKIGLVIIAGVLGVIAVIVALVIHRRSLPSWWLLLGPVPGLVGAWIVLG